MANGKKKGSFVRQPNYIYQTLTCFLRETRVTPNAPSTPSTRWQKVTSNVPGLLFGRCCHLKKQATHSERRLASPRKKYARNARTEQPEKPRETSTRANTISREGEGYFIFRGHLSTLLLICKILFKRAFFQESTASHESNLLE